MKSKNPLIGVRLGLRWAWLVSCLAVFPVKALTQYPGRLNKEQLLKRTENIEAQMKVLPQGESVLRAELTSVLGEEQSIANILSMDDAPPEDLKTLDVIKQSIADLFTYAATFKCGAGQEDELRAKVEAATGRLDNMAFMRDLENTEEYASAFTFLKSNASFIEGKTNGAEACRKLMAELQTGQNVRTVLLALHAKLVADVQEEHESRRELRIAAEGYEKRLAEYKQKIMDQLLKASAQTSLQENLWLMILVIGGLSVIAILVVRLFPVSVMMVWVTSGQVIQFVTVMILLSAIMALGLSGLIKENTLGTLLGGVAGYVLSQGVGKIIQNTTPANPVPQAPAPPAPPPAGPGQ